MTQVQRDFMNHLENNNRIIFSAPFGVGKTYFIQNFFKLPEVSRKYETFTIYPVNYCTADNKDIFDIIKYDLLVQLTEKELLTTETEYKPDYDVLSRFSGLVTKVVDALANRKFGANINPLSNGRILQKICNDFVTKGYKPIKTSDNQLLNFGFEIEQTPGIFLENDIITRLIREKIECITEKTGKEVVFVIEDLDRLDPAHIFRLLNIFSAHERPGEYEHKFGFSKVMFVCDLENVRRIYNHFYGIYTDFQGYISKFYDTWPFSFGNVEAVTNYLEEWFENNVREAGYHYHQEFFLNVFKMLALEDKITYRDIEKLNKLSIEQVIFDEKCYWDFYDPKNPAGVDIKDIRIEGRNIYYLLPSVIFLLQKLLPMKKDYASLFNTKNRFATSRSLLAHADAAKYLFRRRTPFEQLSHVGILQYNNLVYVVSMTEGQKDEDLDIMEILSEVSNRLGLNKNDYD